MLTSDEARRRIDLILKTREHSAPTQVGPTRAISLSAEEFPVPELIFTALHTLLGLPTYGPWEKMAWGIVANYASTSFAINYEKFGLRLYVPEVADSSGDADILRAIRAICSVAESYLKSEIESKVKLASVTISNHYHRFEDAYRFFRSRARRA
ncbi:MAG: hypothetical protein WCB27_14555 [Thermoguttaceae bacterium]